MGKQKMFALLASVFSVCMTAGCSIGIGTQPRVTPSSSSQTNPLQGDDSPIPAGLEDFYRQKAAWTGCSETDLKNYQCAKVKVPLDYEKPQGDTIELQLARRAASGKRLGSLFINPGGPGGSGVNLLKNSQETFSRAVFSAQHF